MTAPTPVVSVSPSPVTAVLELTMPQCCRVCQLCVRDNRDILVCVGHSGGSIGDAIRDVERPHWCPLIPATWYPSDAEVREYTNEILEDKGVDE
jgi:hypothetical protein